MEEKTEFKKRPVLSLAAQSAALAAGLFSLILCVLLVADYVRIQNMDPLNDPHLLQLRRELADSPGDWALIEQIRTFDYYARRAFFSSQEQRRTGGWLLLGGTVICFIALKLSNLWKPELPDIGKPEKEDWFKFNALLRQLLAGAGVLLAAVALFLAFAVQSDLTQVLGQSDGQTGVSAPPVEQTLLSAHSSVPQASLPAFSAAMKTNWPSFRGPGGFGVAGITNAPVSWDVETGKGVLWKAEVPVPGFNSPIVWNGRVFISGADDQGLEVFCFDSGTGKQLWKKTIETSVEFPEVSDDTGYAAPTMTTDGQRIFAIFATGDLAAFDFDGNPVWQKNLGVPKNPYGMGSSLITDGERLFVQYDHEDAQKVLALDCATGNPVWQTARKYISWSSPALIETAAGKQLILNDEANVTAYDPTSGKQIWQVKCLGGEVAPSPAFNGKDIVFVANEYVQASALKLNGAVPEILWQYDDFLPEISSPLAAENLFFIATSAGDVVCLDAATGEVKWEHEFKDGFSSSPVLVGNCVYAVDLSGVVHIFEAADEYKEVGTVAMGEPVYATPAFVTGRIYIRSDETLFCIGD
ncbi:MAG: PQQ-like beta-propeller repeat protein [Pontiellaceae bacterium]|jgi:outer membrane protein assembly factor BamB|nr:PQQ-like beta-propeller repeat protein [Pontiellaceae bacterium]